MSDSLFNTNMCCKHNRLGTCDMTGHICVSQDYCGYKNISTFTITHEERIKLYEREREKLLEKSKEELVDMIIGKRSQIMSL